jgi:hypothetical protein
MSDHESRHRARIADLQTKLITISETIAMLPGRRKAHALQAVEGDREAITAIEQIDVEGTDLQRQLLLTTLALEEAERLDRQHQSKESAIEKAKREAKAKQIGAALVTLNLEADAVMQNLTQILDRRREMISELQRAGGISSSAAFRMLGKETVSAAVYHAGLSKYLALEHVPIASVRPLDSSSKLVPVPA